MKILYHITKIIFMIYCMLFLVACHNYTEIPIRDFYIEKTLKTSLMSWEEYSKTKRRFYSNKNHTSCENIKVDEGIFINDKYRVISVFVRGSLFADDSSITYIDDINNCQQTRKYNNTYFLIPNNKKYIFLCKENKMEILLSDTLESSNLFKDKQCNSIGVSANNKWLLIGNKTLFGKFQVDIYDFASQKMVYRYKFDKVKDISVGGIQSFILLNINEIENGKYTRQFLLLGDILEIVNIDNFSDYNIVESIDLNVKEMVEITHEIQNNNIVYRKTINKLESYDK
ncbi:hypothetical protein CCZ01_09520 [Helicobacter monodelphidis]|uniref:hypothetical protein n=1 Tax=Helicobacter sp. 15-1451 TaxID=2004995 RepID=UPI000DCBC267|nr:hypothetical protein [Helicobacter sp. 15-1451]RAX56442.1 hypothetical protein CCZ01_09520 [Helicobacter sp. 15-1451]